MWHYLPAQEKPRTPQTGLEPATIGLEVRCSVQLSYWGKAHLFSPTPAHCQAFGEERRKSIVHYRVRHLVSVRSVLQAASLSCAVFWQQRGLLSSELGSTAWSFTRSQAASTIRKDRDRHQLARPQPDRLSRIHRPDTLVDPRAGQRAQDCLRGMPNSLT